MSLRPKGAELIQAIVACFHDSSASSFERLSSFSVANWQRAETWLDTSGMTFYFLDLLRSTESSHEIPSSTLKRLEERFAQNKVHSAVLLQEFLAINNAFSAAAICYANLKGFTLVPHSSPDVHLRRQADLDFLVDPANLQSARRSLEVLGYSVSGETARTLEMKTGIKLHVGPDGKITHRHGRSVELHISLESVDPKQRSVVPDERLSRLVRWTHYGDELPALAPADQLICQAVHILSHLRGEKTRLSWLLEFRCHVLARGGDSAFWEELRFRAAGQPDAAMALGLSIMLATDIFGGFSHHALDSWTVDVLPASVCLWASHFGREAVLADAPGTKLYLLLENALEDNVALRSGEKSARRLIPRNRPKRVLQPQPNESLKLRLHRSIVEFRFIRYRLRFHLKHGWLHLINAMRWNALLKQSDLLHRTREKRHYFQASEK